MSKEEKRERQAKTQTVNCREQSDGYQRGDGRWNGLNRWWGLRSALVVMSTGVV